MWSSLGLRQGWRVWTKGEKSLTGYQGLGVGSQVTWGQPGSKEGVSRCSDLVPGTACPRQAGTQPRGQLG